MIKIKLQDRATLKDVRFTQKLAFTLVGNTELKSKISTLKDLVDTIVSYSTIGSKSFTTPNLGTKSYVSSYK